MGTEIKAKNAAKRAYHHGNLRMAVLQAAESALESGGIGSISLREISRELEVSHTAPRRHFETKQALLDALAIHGYEQLGHMLARALQVPGTSFEVRLQRATAVLVRFALKRPALLGHMFAAKHEPEASAELLERLAWSPSPPVSASLPKVRKLAMWSPEIQSCLRLSLLQPCKALLWCPAMDHSKVCRWRNWSSMQLVRFWWVCVHVVRTGVQTCSIASGACAA